MNKPLNSIGYILSLYYGAHSQNNRLTQLQIRSDESGTKAKGSDITQCKTDFKRKTKKGISHILL